MERLLTLYSEVQSTDVRWLWYPFIAIGKITLLQGDPGDGKSTMMMNLIAELSTGGKTPDGCKIGTPQKVIYAGHSFLKNNSRTSNLNLIQSNRKLPTGSSISLKKAI